MRVPLMRPFVNDEVRRKVVEVLDSGFLTEGAVTRELEAAFCEYLGCRHAIAVTSCTTGLEIALRCLQIGPGDEVIVPDYTYPATASVVAIVGATAVIVDCDPATMLMDYDAAAAAIGPRTKAIVPVSMFGNPLDYRRLDAIRSRHPLSIVEDAACALGAEFEGRRVGSRADITVFSLHPRKFITTGEGGVVATERDDWAAWMGSYKHFGMAASAHREGIVFERFGTNAKLSNLQAAVGVVQMRHADALLERRREQAARYVDLLADVPGLELPLTTAGGRHSYQSFCVFVAERDRVLTNLRQRGIEAQIGTYALHRQPAYRPGLHVRYHGAYAGSDRVFDACLALPLFHDMTLADQDMVVESLVALLAPTPQ